MGYRKAPTIYSLAFADPEYKGLEIRLKAVKLGRIREMLSLVGKNEMSGEDMDRILDLVEENLVSWNLEDEDGNPIPVNRAGLDDQEVPFILDIVNTWLEGMTGVSDDLGKDSSSGETFPMPLPTMESL